MYIKVSGKPSKINVKLCKEALKFYGKMLLSDNMYHKITINLKFEEFDIKERKLGIAFCEWVNENHRLKEFLINVHSKLNKKQILLAIAHEMVHVKQYANGELKDFIREDKTKYRDVHYYNDDLDYWDYPWEIEAHGREPGLYYRFIKKLREDKKKKTNKI